MKTAPNPANEPEIPSDFRPMTSAVLKLEVPLREGYNRHWFRGTPQRIAQARQAGYKFVDAEDVPTNNFDLAGDVSANGNTDMGTRVSLITGDETGVDGQPIRLYLMECPEHLFALSQKVVLDRNESVAEALRGGLLGAEKDSTQSDRKARYTKGGIPDLFNPNKRKPGV